MTTGNLRRCAEGLFGGLIPHRNPEKLRLAATFGLVCLGFLVGAVLGGIATSRWHNLAVLIPCATLSIAFALCQRTDLSATVPS